MVALDFDGEWMVAFDVFVILCRLSPATQKVGPRPLTERFSIVWKLKRRTKHANASR